MGCAKSADAHPPNARVDQDKEKPSK
jgi:hypothetical protein